MIMNDCEAAGWDSCSNRLKCPKAALRARADCFASGGTSPALPTDARRGAGWRAVCVEHWPACRRGAANGKCWHSSAAQPQLFACAAASRLPGAVLLVSLYLG